MAIVMTLDRYKTEKIRMLTWEFGVPMSEDEIKYMNSLPSEMRVDAYARDLMTKRFG
jgi:hypothetical protein